MIAEDKDQAFVNALQGQIATGVVPDAATLRRLADLILRRGLKKNRGNQTPVYLRSGAEEKIHYALRAVHKLRTGAMLAPQKRDTDIGLDEAIDIAAQVWGIDQETLRAAYDGKRYSSRRRPMAKSGVKDINDYFRLRPWGVAVMAVDKDIKDTTDLVDLLNGEAEPRKGALPLIADLLKRYRLG